MGFRYAGSEGVEVMPVLAIPLDGFPVAGGCKLVRTKRPLLFGQIAFCLFPWKTRDQSAIQILPIL